ncbi:MAG: aldo/keto reductase [Ardenticatenia bacterium]|nr:MAG: aldo/keto reductase [Ardenticatenia bacterium]
MEIRNLGSTGLRVSGLCLGTMTFARETDEETSLRMIERFIEAGGNFIDTADIYSAGRSEEIVGKALKGRRHDFIIATKVRFRMGPGPNNVGLSRKHIIEGCEASLRRLQTDYIDLYQAHCWDPYTPLEETLAAFDDLVHAGKVRYIGVSNFTGWQLMKALWLSDKHGWARFVCLQPRYNLVDRQAERELLPICREEGLGVIPWSPLGGGFLSGKYERDKPMPQGARIASAQPHWPEAMGRQGTERAWRTLEVVRDIARQRGKTPSQIALAWLLAQPGITAPILGARTLEQLEDNLGCVGWYLTEEELKQLDQASALEDAYPYHFIQSFAYDR